MNANRFVLKRGLKVRRTFHKTMLFPCLCCLTFYAGSQIVGETKASFSSQMSPKPISVATAFVFPATILELEKRAEDLANQMHRNYGTILTNPQDPSIQKMRDRLIEITKIEQKLHQQTGSLMHVHDELSSYHNKLQDVNKNETKTFSYVKEGFLKVDRILKEVQEEINIQKIDSIRTSLALQIRDLEEKEKVSKERHQTTIEPKDLASNQEAEINSNIKKQVTENDEESIANSK